jgi:hypothetical protein
MAIQNNPEEGRMSLHKVCKVILQYTDQTTASTTDEWCFDARQVQENLFCNRIAASSVLMINVAT